ncbi:MAG: hypothetical protein JO352_02585 [Chloroflexi bacterium]|nr:hypothetical protein [Chloroflexota bacterium]MBV9599675.1 hypothetical protein [Chloroflexota bacterium]
MSDSQAFHQFGKRECVIGAPRADLVHELQVGRARHSSCACGYDKRAHVLFAKEVETRAEARIVAADDPNGLDFPHDGVGHLGAYFRCARLEVVEQVVYG